MGIKSLDRYIKGYTIHVLKDKHTLMKYTHFTNEVEHVYQDKRFYLTEKLMMAAGIIALIILILEWSNLVSTVMHYLDLWAGT